MKNALAVLMRLRPSAFSMMIGWSLLIFLFYGFSREHFGSDLSTVLILWAGGAVGISLLTGKIRSFAPSQDPTGDISRTSDLLYHAIVETSPDSVLVTDLTGRFI